jgi:hypothetical protein
MRWCVQWAIFMSKCTWKQRGCFWAPAWLTPQPNFQTTY